MFNSKLKARVAELEERVSAQYEKNLLLSLDISRLRCRLLAMEIVETPDAKATPAKKPSPKKPAPKKPTKK